MPSTQASAATKCISEVPGFAKQTSTPPATKVRTRLSAPFILSLPFAKGLKLQFLRFRDDQPLFTLFVKGVAPAALLPSGARPEWRFFNHVGGSGAPFTRPWVAK